MACWMSRIGGRLSRSSSEKTSANSFNKGIVAEEICSGESSLISLAISAIIVDPWAISLSISLGLISDAFLLLDASVYLVLGVG